MSRVRPIDGDSSDEHATWPTVGVVILNWNNYEDTAECLQSLNAVDYPEMSVYVADNGSTDGSAERLAEEFEGPEFLFNGENLGFAAGCNPAIERALADGADYVLLLNNDAVVEPSFLTPLVETAETNDNVAAVGGVILDESGDVSSAGGEFSPTLVKLSHETDPGDEVYETGFISGAMLLLPREFIQLIDGLNEAYFFGMEDEELAWEARRRGLRLLIDPRSRIHHDGGASATKRSPFRYYHDARNRLQFASENLTLARQFAFAAFFISSRLFRFIQWAARRRWQRIRATLLAVSDFFRDAEHRRVADFE